jgi:hypothetical protein
MTDAGLMGKASIDWDHLDADDHKNLEKPDDPRSKSYPNTTELAGSYCLSGDRPADNCEA